MPSALETLVKILKLEQDSGFQDKAVIGGLQSFGEHWAAEAHGQAKRPEHHLLIDEMASIMDRYAHMAVPAERADSVKYMLGRITGRVPAPPGLQERPAPSAPTAPTPPSPPMAPAAPSVQPSPPVPHMEPPRNDPSPDVMSAAAEPQSPQAAQEPQAPVREDRWREGPPKPRSDERPIQPRRTVPPPTEEDLRLQASAPRRTAPPTYSRRDAEGSLAPVSATPSTHEYSPEPMRLSRGDQGDPYDYESPGRESPLPRREATRFVRPIRRKRGPADPRREVETLRAIKQSVANINGIGPKVSEKLAQLGIITIEDLLYCFPRRYDDYTQMLPLNKLLPDQTLTAIGVVRNSAVIKGKRGADILNVTIDDGQGVLTASFFGQTYLRSKLERGTQVVFSGKTALFRGKVTMTNPQWELLERDALHTRTIVPVYPLTEGLTSHNMRRFAFAAVDQWALQLPDYMPESVLERVDLPELGWAIQQIHFPTSWEALDYARRRLSFDDLILLQLGVLRNRRDWQSQPAGAMTVADEWLDALAGTLPYELTGAQVRAITAIREDLAQEIPMNRLLQGDVGAGKTVVAAAAAAIAIENGYQAAIMAPTSILAEQHFRGISDLLANSSLGEHAKVSLLTGATSAQERTETLHGLADGTIHLVVGTHALLESGVNFQRLGFAVIDEQHRFGVEQRGRLRGKGSNPHLLVMTATPIPRTLALTMYADLDLTVLDEMPPGRTPIETMILQPKERERAYSFIDAQIAKGRQAFVVYPLVEASESNGFSEARSATEEYERLQNEVFPGYKVGLLHGRLSSDEKEEAMGAFSRGETQILVSTSVVEVGIDVPNASVMLIEGANRFGLAQLHQFRGRVGRGEHASFCLLMPDSGEDNNERLQAMTSTTDGFKLAEIDWELRGAGELLGTRQSGGSARLGEFMHPRTVEEAQFEARTIYEEDPDLSLPEHSALRERLRLTFGDRANADQS